MKSPDEIKKGLELCNADECHGQHTDCPYHQDLMCIRNICADALAYIQQLEAERDALQKYITDSTWAACDICKHGIDGASVLDCKHIREVGVPCFEWRGVQKEDSDA